MEVCGQASRLSGTEDASRLVDVEDSLFAEHIDVVDVQLTTVQSAFDVRQLDIDDVIGRILCRAVPVHQALVYVRLYIDYRTLVCPTTYQLMSFYYCIGLSPYIAITNLPILAVFVECLRQFLIDLNQIYRHSSVP